MGSLSSVPEKARYPNPVTADHITYNPSLEDLRRFSTDVETTTEYGSPAYVSEYRSRSADRIKNAVDTNFNDTDFAVFEEGLR
jgi:phosphoenolpyruvate carboxykinase (ATP)